jgi:hypothetical protein
MDECILPEWRFTKGRKPDVEEVMKAVELRSTINQYLKKSDECIAECGRLARKNYLVERKLVMSNMFTLTAELSIYLFWRRTRNDGLRHRAV